jgi:regulatory protein
MIEPRVVLVNRTSPHAVLIIHAVEFIARGDRLRIDVGADEPIELAAAVCPTLREGDEIDDAGLRALIERSADYDTREAALHLLSYRPRSVRELRDRLLRKGLDAERIDHCLAGLREAGFLDDAAFAEAHTREAVRLRPRGSRRLVAELRQKGVADATAAAAVQRVMVDEDSPDSALALRAAEGWYRRAGDDARTLLCGRGDRAQVERVRRRFWSYMSRRGFGPDAIRSALDGVCA